MIKRSEIRTIDIFRGLSKDHMDELMSWVEPLVVPFNRSIIREGKKPDGLYLLFEGEVEVLKRTDKGPVRVNEIQAPSFFGEISLLTDQDRSTSIHSITDCRLGRIPRDLYLGMLEKQNSTALLITLNIGKLLSLRLAETNEQMEYLSARERRLGVGQKYRDAAV